jgi:uncharacterized membrane protein YqaE (UPF0057 family)
MQPIKPKIKIVSKQSYHPYFSKVQPWHPYLAEVRMLGLLWKKQKINFWFYWSHVVSLFLLYIFVLLKTVLGDRAEIFIQIFSTVLQKYFPIVLHAFVVCYGKALWS